MCYKLLYSGVIKLCGVACMSVKVVVLPCATDRFGTSCKAAHQFSTNQKRPLNQSECKEGPFCWNHRKNILHSNGGSFRSYNFLHQPIKTVYFITTITKLFTYVKHLPALFYVLLKMFYATYGKRPTSLFEQIFP